MITLWYSWSDLFPHVFRLVSNQGTTVLFKVTFPSRFCHKNCPQIAVHLFCNRIVWFLIFNEKPYFIYVNKRRYEKQVDHTQILNRFSFLWSKKCMCFLYWKNAHSALNLCQITWTNITNIRLKIRNKTILMEQIMCNNTSPVF